MTDTDGVLAAIDACLDDYEVSDDAMRWAPDEPEPTPTFSPARIAANASAFVEAVNGMRCAAQAMLESFGKTFGPFLSATQSAMHRSVYSSDRKHARRCPTCNPRGFPKPLPINGHEYNRRRRARARR